MLLSRLRLREPMRRAFTLVEMVIVLMVISIMAAAAAPRLHRALSYHRATTAAQRIKVDLQYARQYAKTTSSSQSIQFNILGQSYTCPGLPNLNRKSTAYAVALAEHPYEVALVDANFGGLTSLTFNGFGIPDRSGTVVVQSGQFQRTVVLDANGIADIQ